MNGHVAGSWERGKKLQCDKVLVGGGCQCVLGLQQQYIACLSASQHCVVSVLISVTTDMSPTGDFLSHYLLEGGGR